MPLRSKRLHPAALGLLAALVAVTLGGAALLQDSAAPALDGAVGTLSIISHPLQIRKHPAASLTDAESADIMQLGTNLLNQCRSVFTRVGSVQNAALPSVINSQADMQAACGTSFVESAGGYEPLGRPRGVKVVNAINWCGSTGTGIIGCAFTPGTCMVVRRYTPAMEGILWTHEFGHSKGLQHRSDTQDAIMYPSVGSTHVKFTPSECSAVRQLSFYAEAQGPPIATLANMPIRDFVVLGFPHGVPYDEARAYSSADVATVTPWLSDVGKRPYWTNVVSVTGIVADGAAFAKLKSFIFGPGAGRLTIEEYDARVAAIMSLGYVIRGNGSSLAGDLLREYSVPAKWNAVQWMAPYHASAAERNQDLANAAVLGLGLSKELTHLAFLRQLARVRPSGRNAADSDAVRQAMIELLEPRRPRR